MKTLISLPLVIIILTGLVVIPGAVLAQGGDEETQPSLTWDDAVDPPAVRHIGDAQVRWGWQDAADVSGIQTDRKYEAGDRFSFLLGEGNKRIHELRYVSEYAYFWFPWDSKVSPAAVEEAALYFDENIWYLDRYIYGENATPGIDGDERIHIVHLEDSMGYLGFFRPDDQCANHICTDSNVLDAIYVAIDAAPLNSTTYYSTIAHEFQHLIQFNIDGNEYRWMDEGFSQFAEFLHGFADDPVNSDNLREYLGQPNHYLNGWTFGWDVARHYGAGYLFITYLYERFGLAFINELANNPLNGLSAVADTLKSREGLLLNEVVMDWFIANHLNNSTYGDGRYGYTYLELPRDVSSQPLNMYYEGYGLNQFGADYLEFNQPGMYTLEFSGDVQTPLVTAEPRSGEWMWWSYNSTASATTLTRPVDLRDVDSATLTYSLWWSLGDLPGYMHVLVSTDEGQTWEILEGDYMQAASVDWYEYAQGPHYGGFSDGWIDDQIDLSEYTGQEVHLRFEYITNNAVTGQGVVLDDIAIPELGLLEDAESAESEWVTDGFIRTGQMVDQNWFVAIVGNDSASINVFEASDGRLSTRVEIPFEGAMIIVSPMAPITSLPADYTLELRPTKN